MKKILSILLSVTMLLSLLTVGAVMEAPAVAAAPQAQSQPLLRYGRSVLASQPNAAHRLWVYDRIVESLSTDLESTTISTTYNGKRMSFDESFDILSLVLADYPEFFFVGQTVYGNDNYIRPVYWVSGSERQAAEAALMAQVEALTAGLEGKSDYIKSLTIHDRLIETVTYAMVGQHQTAYGALVGGKAVCAGYARAYQLLMNHVGIPTWYISGTANNGYASGDHAWSLAQLDGNWYYTDVTWDDTDYDGWLYYEYFNVTYDYIRTNHFEDAVYADLLPAANSIDCAYGVCSSLMMERFDLEKVREVLRKNPNARFYVIGDAEAFLEEVRNHLDELTGEYNWSSFSSGISGSLVTIELKVYHTCTFQKITVAATCSNPAYTVERCSHPFCAEEKNRAQIAGSTADGAHVYSHSDDLLCDVCAQRRTTCTHAYDNACDSICNSCGEERSVPGHVYDHACDATCNICGAIRSVAGHAYDNACDVECNVCHAIRTVPGHVYRSEFDTDCDACGALRQAPADLLFQGNSVSEDVTGLAFVYKANVAGATIQGKYKADYSAATLNGYQLLGMGAVLSNGWEEITIPAQYLLEVNSHAETVTFAVRITDIPAAHWEDAIQSTPYYTVEINGEVVTFYGETQSASYISALA